MKEAKSMPNQIVHMRIEKAIEILDNEDYRNILSQFMEAHKDSQITVTEKQDVFEAIVHHPSYSLSENEHYTGGAEQYFIDKTTGSSKIGWHEHPMKIHNPIQGEINADDSDNDKK